MKYLRLKKQADFERLFQKGKRAFSPTLTMIYRPSDEMRMGISIGKFIAGKKVDFARYALRCTNMSVAEIAEEAGFANIYVFSTFFKRHTGVSPLRFRQQMQQKKEM